MRLALLASILVVPACVADPEVSSTDQAIHDRGLPPNIPAALTPAADQVLAFHLNAIGVQKYTCTAGAWVFVAPDAQLYNDHSAHSVGHHYAGPTWEYQDGSTVVAAKVAAASVDPASIPWLLLTAKSHNAIDGRMTDVSSIQRLETHGGNAPAGGCADGATLDVPYTATYFFYRTRSTDDCND
jgi:hypothetical protein